MQNYSTSLNEFNPDQVLTDLDGLGGLDILLNNFPNLYFWIKDTNGRYIMGNQLVAEKCGMARVEDIIGKTDYDFFPSDMCKQVLQDDLIVIKTQEKIINRIEALPNEDGTFNWYSTNKVPVFNKENKVVGVAGTTRDLNKAIPKDQYYMEMADIIEHISKNYHKAIDIKELAKMSALSVSQFERRFKEIFRESPLKFIIKTRIKAACKKLGTTKKTISWIAMETGFYDHSAFSKQFTKHIGMTPGEYRSKYFKGG